MKSDSNLRLVWLPQKRKTAVMIHMAEHQLDFDITMRDDEAESAFNYLKDEGWLDASVEPDQSVLEFISTLDPFLDLLPDKPL